jgi:hypothetical protein
LPRPPLSLPLSLSAVTVQWQNASNMVFSKMKIVTNFIFFNLVFSFGIFVLFGYRVSAGPSLWFSLMIYNQNNSNNVYITLSEQTTNTSVTQLYIMTGSSHIVNTSLLYPIYTRAMATAGGTTGSAQTTFNKFQLFLK